MQIGVGDRLPAASFMTMEIPEGACATGKPLKIESSEIFNGKNVVLVAVPGAFTPTCSEKHIPAFIQRFEEFKGKGIDKVVVLSTNDVFVMAYWAQHLGNKGRLTFLSDGNATFVKELGLTLDLSQHMMGTRSQRFAMIVKDGIVKYLAADSGPVLGSSAETVLANIKI